MLQRLQFCYLATKLGSKPHGAARTSFPAQSCVSIEPLRCSLSDELHVCFGRGRGRCHYHGCVATQPTSRLLFYFPRTCVAASACAREMIDLNESGTNRNTRKFTALQVIVLHSLTFPADFACLCLLALCCRDCLFYVAAVVSSFFSVGNTTALLQCHRHVTLLLHDFESSRASESYASPLFYS